MRIEKKKDESLIEITDDIRLPGTDVILEAGDKVKVLDEGMDSIRVGLIDAYIEDINMATGDDPRAAEEFRDFIMNASDREIRQWEMKGNVVQIFADEYGYEV